MVPPLPSAGPVPGGPVGAVCAPGGCPDLAWWLLLVQLVLLQLQLEHPQQLDVEHELQLDVLVLELHQPAASPCTSGISSISNDALSRVSSSSLKGVMASLLVGTDS